jgi:hypothetical protein
MFKQCLYEWLRQLFCFFSSPDALAPAIDRQGNSSSCDSQASNPTHTFHRIVFNPYTPWIKCRTPNLNQTLSSTTDNKHLYSITYVDHGWTFYHVKPHFPFHFAYSNNLPDNFSFVRVKHIKKNIPYDILYDSKNIPTLLMLTMSALTQYEFYRVLSLKTLLPPSIYKLFPPIYFECLNCHHTHDP